MGYGKYAASHTLAPEYDNTFKAIITAGWANQSSGDVEAPTGFFALVTIAPDELDELVDAALTTLRDGMYVRDENLPAPPVGNYVTYEDNNGIIWVDAYPTVSAAQHEYNARENAYHVWEETLPCGCTEGFCYCD